MPLPAFAAWMLEQEARAMRTRLAGVRPFALQESMQPAANLLPSSQIAIEKFLSVGRTELRHLLDEFLRWLRSAETANSGAEEAQRRFTLLRLRFNSVLTQFDLFDNVITQRSENQTGVWLSGLDVASADALRLREKFFEPPAIICYLDRGTGAAKKLLPVAGTAVGGYFGGPAGASLGGNIASTLAGSLEMERDEMEWESAKTFVRLAADATKTAALTPPGETPEDTARKAVTDSALKNAPALLVPAQPSLPPLSPMGPVLPAAPSPPLAAQCPVCGSGHRGGRWMRRGNQIVLFGI